MALLATDLISPLGNIRQDMFPSETLTNGTDGLVDVLLAKAVTLTDDESKQEAFVYWKAYRDVANRFAANPYSEKILNISNVYNESQYMYFQAKAVEWQAKYEGDASILPAKSLNAETIVVW